MAKIFTAIEWENEVLDGDPRYDISTDGGSPIESNVQIEQITDVLTPGTGVTADNMNRIEEAINLLDDFHVVYTTTGTSTAYLLDTPQDQNLSTEEHWMVKFHTAAGASPTLNRDAKGAKALKYYNSSGAKTTCTSVQITSGLYTRVIYDGTDYIVLDPAGGSASSTVDNTTFGGRLTVLSGDAAPQTDQTVKTNIYLTPYTGNYIALYVSSVWTLYSFTERTLSLASFTTGKNNDVFVYDNAGTITLERVEWTNDSTRATALVLQDGVLVKSGETNKRYCGTFRTSATGQCEDSVSKRYVWNYYNRVERYCQVTGTTGHTNTSASVIQWNNDAAMKFEYVIGVKEDQVFITLLNDYLAAATSSTTQGCVGLGINTIAALTATSYWASAFQGRSSNNTVTIPALGYNYVALLERGLTGVTFNVAQASMLLKG